MFRNEFSKLCRLPRYEVQGIRSSRRVEFCLLTTLRAIARDQTPGLTPRQIIANLKTIKMVDVVIPTSDGRVVTLPRYIEPREEVALLLNRLGFTLPGQPPPKISEASREA